MGPVSAENVTVWEALGINVETYPESKRLHGFLRGSFVFCFCAATAEGRSWVDSQSCDSCVLARQNDSILCKKDSLYFLYAQVAFNTHHQKANRKSVFLIRYPSHGKSEKKIAEGIYASTTEASVWVSRVIKLRKGDRVKINITGDFLQDISYWGAFELH